MIIDGWMGFGILWVWILLAIGISMWLESLDDE